MRPDLFASGHKKTISFVWQALGVQHVLLPGESDSPEPSVHHAEPSVPALTPKGFVRWQSIQILREPEVHVPLMQIAVKYWKLQHPDTGIAFPPDIPVESFPKTGDPQLVEWHRDCGNELRFNAEYLLARTNQDSGKKLPSFRDRGHAPMRYQTTANIARKSGYEVHLSRGYMSS